MNAEYTQKWFIAIQWQGFLLRYGGDSSVMLHDSVAALTCHIANNMVNWLKICALMASRLIAVDKTTGVRPIGIGEVLHKILGKVVVSVMGV